jgi:putative acetyltransferase
MVSIRQEGAKDLGAIREVNVEAFDRRDEADLVEALRESGAITISLVAERGRGIVGHILFSPVTVESAETTWTAQGLAPLAVRPADQGQGIGSAMVKAGLTWCLQQGHDVVFVLGHPHYYPRFGFVPSRPLGVRWEKDVPDEAFMVVELRDGALAGRQGIVKYHPAFGDV